MAKYYEDMHNQFSVSTPVTSVQIPLLASMLNSTQKVKRGEVHTMTCQEGPEGEWRYSFNHSAWLGGEVDGQHYITAALPRGMTQYPLYRTPGRPVPG